MPDSPPIKYQNTNPGVPALKHWTREYLLAPVLYTLLCLCFLPYSYPAFHFFAEFGSIIVGLLALVIAVISYRFLQNSFLLILAVGLGWSEIFDLVHVAAYQGMNLLPPDRLGSELASQLWIIARFLQAATSLMAVLLINHVVSPAKVNFTIAGYSVIVLALLFAGYFPDTYLPETGLTAFKVNAEFVIIFGFLAATALLIVRRKNLQRDIYLGALLAFVIMALADFCFTAYFSVYDGLSATGHVLKIFAYWFVFRILVLRTMLEPFRERGRLISDLRERVKELRALHELSVLTDKSDINQRQVLQHASELLPASFYYPDFLLVSISSPWGHFGDDSLVSVNRRIEEVIKLDSQQEIKIVVGYAEDAEIGEPVFLEEEYLLMNMVSTRIRDVLVRIGSNQEINKLKELNALLSRINRAITKSDTRDTLIDLVIRAIKKSTAYTAVFIANVDYRDNEDSFRLLQMKGANDDQTTNIESFLNSLPDEYILAPFPLHEQDPHLPVVFSLESNVHEEIRHHLHSLEFTHLVLIPLVENNKVELLLGLYLISGEQLSDEYMRLLQDMQSDLEYALRTFNETRKRIQAESLMMDSEERFRTVFMKSPVPMVMFDTDGKSKGLSNQAFEAWSGIPPETELSPREYLESYFLGPDKEEFINEYWSGALRQASESAVVVETPEVKVRHYNGAELTVTAKLIRVNNQIVLALTDLTEIRRQEKELLESEARFRSMIEEVTLPVSICHDGVFVYINPCLREMLGNEYEPVGRSLDDYFTVAAGESVDVSSRWGPSPGEPSISHDVIIKRANGEECILNMQVSNISWDGGRACMSVGEDVTLRRQFEQKLADSFELLNNLSEQIPGVIYQFQLLPDGRFSFPFCSELIKEIYEVTPDQVKEDASIVFERIHPDDKEELERKIYESADKLTDWIDDYRVILPEQGVQWRSGFARPQKLDDGSVLWHGFIEDSTERMNSRLELDRTNRELERSMKGTLEVLSRVVDLRDPYTAGHERRVGELAALIGREVGLDEHEVENLRLAGLVHDIGKIAIPAEILSKPARISDSEYELIKTHAQAGYEILKGVPLNDKIKEAIWQHHERLDGSGYPRGLKGDEVSLEARILAVSDVIESMASHRPYRPAKGMDAAMEELSSHVGVLYDEHIVAAASRVVSKQDFDLEML